MPAESSADRGALGAPRRQFIVERLTEFVTYRDLGWSVARIAWEMGVTDRTVWRWAKRLREGEPPGPTESELAHWSRSRSPNPTPRLLAAAERGRDIAGPQDQPVEYRPRRKFDHKPWLAADGTRHSGAVCRALGEPDWG